MKKKSYFRLMLALGALTLALGMNFRFAINDYGIKTSTLSLSVFANVSESSEDCEIAGLFCKKCLQKHDYHIQEMNYCSWEMLKFIVKDGITWRCAKGEGSNCKEGFVGTIKNNCTNQTTTTTEDDLSTKCS